MTAQLAEYVHLDRSAVIRNLKALMPNGWIEDKSEDFVRGHCYYVSQSEEELLNHVKPVWEAAQNEIESYMGIEAMKDLKEKLYKIQEL